MTDSQSTTSTTLSLHPRLLALVGVPPTRAHSRNRYWHYVEHVANRRRGIDESVIWEHSTKYEACNRDRVHAWRYLYCTPTYLVLLKFDSTSNSLHHLRTKYSIGGKSTRKWPRVEEDDEIAGEEEEAVPQIRGIMIVTNVETFRYKLTH